MKQPSQWLAGEKNRGGEYAARAMSCEEKPAGLNNKRKQSDTERNRGAETGASNSKRSCIPIATKQSKWRYFVGGVDIIKNRVAFPLSFSILGASIFKL